MKDLTREDFQKAVYLFSRRHLEDFYPILHRLEAFYSVIKESKLKISIRPNKQDIEKITKLLIETVKFAYQGTVLENESAIKFCYLNGNCDYFVGTISAIYENLLGIKTIHSSGFPSENGNKIYMLPVGRSFNFLPKKEKKDALYTIGFGWEEKFQKHKKQPFTYHRVLYLNGEYFDICGGKNEIAFKAYLRKNFHAQTDNIFKTVSNDYRDIFTQFLVKCVELDRTTLKLDENCENLKV